MNEWVLTHVVRVSALVAALAPVVASVAEVIPWQGAVPLSAMVVTAGEIAQRVENGKTLRALLTTPPE